MGRVATDFAYLATIVAFILALKFLSHPATARRGNWIGAVGMLIAIAVTFAQKSVVSYWEIVVGMAVGGSFGAVAARRPSSHWRSSTTSRLRPAAYTATSRSRSSRRR